MANVVIAAEKYKVLEQHTNRSFIFHFDAEEQKDEEGDVVLIECNEASVIIPKAGYDELVSALIAVKYSQDAQLALMYNIAKDAKKYAGELEAYQQWRTYCKQVAHTVFD